jgi:hypothetical protein
MGNDVAPEITLREKTDQRRSPGRSYHDLRGTNIPDRQTGALEIHEIEELMGRRRPSQVPGKLLLLMEQLRFLGRTVPCRHRSTARDISEIPSDNHADLSWLDSPRK